MTAYYLRLESGIFSNKKKAQCQKKNLSLIVLLFHDSNHCIKFFLYIKTKNYNLKIIIVTIPVINEKILFMCFF